MTERIPWLPKVSVTHTGEIIDRSKKKFKEEGDFIHIPLRTVRKPVRVHKEWLFWFCRFNFPEYVDVRTVRFYHTPWKRKDGLPHLHAYFTRPYEVKPGFRLCAVRPHLAVSKDGEVFNIETGKILQQSQKGKQGGYPLINTRNPISQKNETIVVHRLIANAWVGKNQDSLHPEVNHINGIKSDCRACNLEWCTRHENVKHLHRTGLGSTIRACEVKDITTHKVYKFDSSTQAAAFMGIDCKKIQSDHLWRTNALYKSRYEFRYCDMNRPWFYTEDMEIISAGGAIYVYIVTIPGREKRLVFNGGVSFKEYFRIWKYRGRVAGNASEIAAAFRKKYPTYQLKVIRRNPDKRIEVRDVNTGEVKVYRKMSQVAKALGTHQTTIKRPLFTNGYHQWRNYQLRYKSNKPWPKPVRSEMTYLIRLTHNETGEQRIFESQQQVAEFLHCCRSVVGIALKRGYFLKHPYRIEYLDKY